MLSSQLSYCIGAHTRSGSTVTAPAGAGGSDGGGGAAEGGVAEAPDTEGLRRDLLTGHLLALATEDGLPRHALPALAASLQVGRSLRPLSEPQSDSHHI